MTTASLIYTTPSPAEEVEITSNVSSLTDSCHKMKKIATDGKNMDKPLNSTEYQHSIRALRSTQSLSVWVRSEAWHVR